MAETLTPLLPPTEATYASVYDAGTVRLFALGAKADALLAEGCDAARVEQSINDLYFGLELLAMLVPGSADADAVLGYLIETYGLLAVGTDPFLRPWLPPIGASGAVVRRRVLRLNGRLLRLNGRLLSTGAELVAAPFSVPTTPATT